MVPTTVIRPWLSLNFCGLVSTEVVNQVCIDWRCSGELLFFSVTTSSQITQSERWPRMFLAPEPKPAIVGLFSIRVRLAQSIHVACQRLPLCGSGTNGP